MFITNPLNEDLQHPVQVSGIRMVNGTEDAKVFIHRPDLGYELEFNTKRGGTFMSQRSESDVAVSVPQEGEPG